MFLNFEHKELGFTDEEWEEVPRTDKVIIRDFELNGRNVDQTMLYNWYETDRKVRGAVNTYKLRARPRLQVALADIHIPYLSSASSPQWA